MNPVYSIVAAAATYEPGTSTNPIVLFLNTVLEKFFDLTNLIGWPSYALALLIFTIIIKMLLYPLAIKQMRSSRDMQRLQPKLKALQEKYKNNPQKMQEAQMKLYRDMNINPMGGCLPLLLQIPIIWMLFASIRNFVPAHPEFYKFFWIPDLAAPDPTGILLPLLVAASTFLQQWISVVNRKDPTQKAMLIIMPIMMGFFCRSFPSGVALYWIFYGLLSGIQQFFINRKGKAEDARLAAIEAEKERILEEERAAARAEKAARMQNQKGKKPVKAAPQKPQIDFSDEAFEAVEARIAELELKWAPPGSDAARELADAEDKLAAMKKARDEFEQQVAEAAEDAVETREN